MREGNKEGEREKDERDIYKAIIIAISTKLLAISFKGKELSYSVTIF